MDRTGWKILLTIACLIMAGGMMFGFRNVSASETEEMSVVTEAEPETEKEEPSIEWRMEEAECFEGISYYRQDNCGLSVIISDVTSELVLAEVKIGDAAFSLEDFEITEPGTYVFDLTAEEMSDLIPNDGEVTAYVYVKDADEVVSEDAHSFVLDRTNPSFAFVVSGPEDHIFYQGEASGQEVRVLSYEPFQQSEWAKIVIRAKDEMGCRTDYQIQSSISGTISGKSDAGQPFLTESEMSETVNGQQRFWIDGIEVRDRAGNVSCIGRSNTLFLDMESPAAEVKAPEPVVLATEAITHRNADGRGIYKDDVTLRVTVSDDGEQEQGCGLKNVSCKVLVNGEETDALSDCLNDAPDFPVPEEIVYGDDSALENLQTSYTGTVTIPKGGIFETNDIEVLVYATDYAGNGTEEALARFQFGIDSEGPMATVSFDNNAVQNERYFKEPRTATIQIRDRNIDAGLIKVDTQSSEISAGTYERGNDDTGNGDCFEKTVRYDQDGTYTLEVTGTDALGNAFEKEVRFTGTSPDQFVIDQTAPVISVEQVEAGTAYNGTIAPVVRFSDENFSKDLTEVSLSGAREGDRKDLLSAIMQDASGASCTMQDIPVKKENDDIYTLRAKLKDLAGNESRTELEFSVNRFGSTYDYNNDRDTQELMGDYFTGQEKRVYLREINQNRLTDQKVTLYHDGANRVLQQGIEYQVTQEAYGDSMQYIYAFAGHNFRKEGIYEVVVQSVDAAGNINSNHVMRQDDGIESVRIRFAVDKTAPQILLNGSDATKAPVFSEGEEIQILPGDNMQLQNVELSLSESQEGKGTVLEAYNGTALLKKLMATDGVLSFSFDAQNKEQDLVIRAVDAAGNVRIGTASCMSEPKMQRAGVFTPRMPSERSGETNDVDRDGWYGIPVAAAGMLLLILLGRKKHADV